MKNLFKKKYYIFADNNDKLVKQIKNDNTIYEVLEIEKHKTYVGTEFVVATIRSRENVKDILIELYKTTERQYTIDYYNDAIVMY